MDVSVEKNSNRFSVKILTMSLVGLCVISLVWVQLTNKVTDDVPTSISEVVIAQPKKLRNLAFFDHNKNQFNEQQLLGKWSLVFFGYTHCPDVCPATMMQLVTIKNSLSPLIASNEVPQFLFVTVDPSRDKTSTLSEFINYFDKSFFALRGSNSSIGNLEQQLNAAHSLGRKNSQGEYSVAHSAAVYLIDPLGSSFAKFLPPFAPAQMTRQIIALQNYFHARGNY